MLTFLASNVGIFLQRPLYALIRHHSIHPVCIYTDCTQWTKDCGPVKRC